MRFLAQSLAHLAALASLAACAPAFATSEDDARQVRFSGFGTLGMLHNQADGAEFIRDITQPRGATNKGLSWNIDSRVGIQGNYAMAETVEAVAQVVSRYRWDHTFRPELTWGFLRYTPHDAIALRAGRIGFDAFLAADSRDVGFSYLWARPPVEYYGTIPFPYLDGFDVVLRTPLGNGTGRLKAYSGISRQQVPTAGVLEDLAGSRVIGGFLDYQDSHWTARLGLTDLRILRGLPDSFIDLPGLLRSAALAQPDSAIARELGILADDTALAGKHVVFKSIALAYEDGPLQTQVALSKFTPGSLTFPHSWSAYLSAGYRFGKLTPYVGFAVARSEKIRRADEFAGRGVGLTPVMSIMNYMFASGTRNQHTYTLGARYDLKEKVALKLQVDIVRNRTCSPLSLPVIGSTPPCAAPILWPGVPTEWNGRANVYSAALDFIF